jgi:Amt family ammonium transporter
MLGASTDVLLRRDDSQSQFDRGDIAFILICGCMVSFMIPGLAFLYGGLARRKSALSLMWIVSAANAVVVLQWVAFGYSLAFSPTASNGFIGNMKSAGLRDVLGDPSPGSPLIPELLYSFYQMEFACVTVGIIVGGIAERGRVLPAMLFSFLWVSLVYCPIAYWAWGAHGWGFTWGVLDFAGGGPVEIGSGVGGLAYSWVLGRRRDKELMNFRPHNVSLIVLGTFILWFGWLGFNGGSALGANLRAVMAVWNSMIAGALGGIVWCLLDYRIGRKYSMVGFCSGTVAGLVAATPASGYIQPWSAAILGVITGALCNVATNLKFIVDIDDSLDMFAEHAIGGIIGLLFNGFFASGHVIALDGVNTAISGGFLDRNWKQLYIQFAYVCATCGYTFVVSAMIAKAVDMVPGMHLRLSEAQEALGVDEVEIGEFASDYIEVRRDYRDWTAPMYPAAKSMDTLHMMSMPARPDNNNINFNVSRSYHGNRHSVDLKTDQDMSEKPDEGIY